MDHLYSSVLFLDNTGCCWYKSFTCQEEPNGMIKSFRAPKKDSNAAFLISMIDDARLSLFLVLLLSFTHRCTIRATSAPNATCDTCKTWTWRQLLGSRSVSDELTIFHLHLWPHVATTWQCYSSSPLKQAINSYKHKGETVKMSLSFAEIQLFVTIRIIIVIWFGLFPTVSITNEDRR